MPDCYPFGMTCHQSNKRTEQIILEGYWQQDPSPDYVVEPIGKQEAFDFIRAYEYLGTVGRPQARYGALDVLTGRLAAVALFGNPTNLPAGHIVLERGACAPFAHVHAASWFLPRVIRRANQDHGWHTFIAYADPDADEIGTVYQAAGWRYVGQSSTRTLRGKPRPREYFIVENGKMISEKAFRARGHILSDCDLLGWSRVFKSPKHKYVTVIGRDRRETKRLWAALPPALPYPKRD